MRSCLFLAAFMLSSFNCNAQTPLDSHHIEISPGIIRVGKNIAYSDKFGNLKLSRPAWIRDEKHADSYECKEARLRVKLEPPSSEWPLLFEYKGKILKARPAGFGYYKPAKDELRILAKPNLSLKREYLEKRCIVDRQIYPLTDHFYHVFKNGFYTNFSVEIPFAMGMPEKGETYLASLTELDLESLRPYRIYFKISRDLRNFYQDSDVTEIENEVNQITSTLRSGENTRSRRLRIELPLKGKYELIFTFGDQKISDPVRHGENIYLPKFLQQVGGKHYLVVLIPVSYFNQSQRPLSFFGLRVTPGANPNPNEVFFAGNTYVIDGAYQIKSLTSLGEPENPIFVKFLPGRQGFFEVTKKGGKGVLVDNTIFTSAFDNHPERGGDVTLSNFGLSKRPPHAGDYKWAIAAVKGRNQKITNSQFFYASTALTKPVGTKEPLTLENVIIENCAHSGAELCDWGIFNHNTVRKCNRGVVVSVASGRVTNSIFAGNHNLGCSALPSLSTHNVFYRNRKHTEGEWRGELFFTGEKRRVSPFTTGRYGDCYLNLRSRFAKRIIHTPSWRQPKIQLSVLSVSDEKDRKDEPESIFPYIGFNYPDYKYFMENFHKKQKEERHAVRSKSICSGMCFCFPSLCFSLRFHLRRLYQSCCRF